MEKTFTIRNFLPLVVGTSLMMVNAEPTHAILWNCESQCKEQKCTTEKRVNECAKRCEHSKVLSCLIRHCAQLTDENYYKLMQSFHKQSRQKADKLNQLTKKSKKPSKEKEQLKSEINFLEQQMKQCVASKNAGHAPSEMPPPPPPSDAPPPPQLGKK